MTPGVLVADHFTHPWSLEVNRRRWAVDWDYAHDAPSYDHFCYFCHPRGFPPMLPMHTLCVLCGGLMRLDHEDPMNREGEACQPCDDTMREEFAAGRIG